MLEGSIEDLTKIAADSATPSHLLVELSKHGNSQIRSLVASNPNTPLETLKSLCGFADAIVANPVFDLLQLEDGNSKFIRLTLAISTKTPPEALTQLIATEDLDDVCYALGRNASTPINTLTSIAIAIVSNKNFVCVHDTFRANHQFFKWLDLVLDIISRPDISESNLEKIIDVAIDRDRFELLCEWIRIPKLSFSMLEKLSKYPEKHPDKRIEGFDELLIDFPTVKESPILLDNVARNIGNNDLRHKEDVFLKIANNPRTLSSTIEYLAAHHSPQVRNALANHPNCSRKASDIFLLTQ